MDPLTQPGAGDRFPDTRPSMVQNARSSDPALRERGLHAVATGYWRPVYKYLRIQWRASTEEAEDLTQAFFVTLLERDLLARYEIQQAKFRTYLRTCLDRLVTNEREAQTRKKRGGEFRRVPLDFETAEGELRQHDVAAGLDPEELFHREWIRDLFSRAVNTLRDQSEAEGRTRAFEIFSRYDLADASDAAPSDRPADKPSYSDLSQEFDVPVTQITNDLHRIRRRFRETVLAELRSLTASEQEFEEEARDLFGGTG